MVLIHRVAVAIALLTVAVASVSTQGTGADWPQWRGPSRDGTASFRVPQNWPDALTQKWKVEVGLGYATPLVVGNRVYVFSRQGEDEVMRAIDAESGKVLWQQGYPASFTMNKATTTHGPGPKSTPVFANGRLYSIGMTGVVTARDAATGTQLWQKPGGDVVPLYTTHSFSPLVDGDRVIFHVGGHDQGALTAFDLDTGEVKWSWTGDGPGYGSPVVTTLGGTKQIVTLTQTKVVGVDAATGALLWERPMTSPSVSNSVTPVVHGQTIVLAGAGPLTAFTAMKRNDQWTTETIWENPELTLRFSTGVLAGDVIFGLSGRNAGQYYAVDARSGKTLWISEGRQASHASIAKAGDVFFSWENDGELVVVRNSPSGFEPIRRYKLAEPETWTQAAYSGDRVFVKDTSTVTLWTLN